MRPLPRSSRGGNAPHGPSRTGYRCYITVAASNPSHPLIGLTFRFSGACRGWPQSSSSCSGASCLRLIMASCSVRAWVSPKCAQRPHWPSWSCCTDRLAEVAAVSLGKIRATNALDPTRLSLAHLADESNAKPAPAGRWSANPLIARAQHGPARLTRCLQGLGLESGGRFFR
jgi:hypothetical protein